MNKRIYKKEKLQDHQEKQKNIPWYNFRSNKSFSKQNEYEELNSTVATISDLEEINVEESLSNTHWRMNIIH